MSRENIGIEDARKTLGDLVTAVQQGDEFVITRNGKPAARIVSYQEEMLGVAELAAAVLMSSSPEKVARWAGCFTPHDPRTGRLPKPWYGQGMDATFTREQIEQLRAEWHRDAAHMEGMEFLLPDDAEVAEVAERYRP
jgi:prevent-host-death family protein